MHYDEQSRSDSSYAGRRGRVAGDDGRATGLRFQLACQLAEPLRFHRDQTDFVRSFSMANLFWRGSDFQAECIQSDKSGGIALVVCWSLTFHRCNLWIVQTVRAFAAGDDLAFVENGRIKKLRERIGSPHI